MPAARRAVTPGSREAGLDGRGREARWRRRQPPHTARARTAIRTRSSPGTIEPVGVDIERIEPVDADFARSICTYSETQRLPVLDDRLVASLWCGKEALSKALGDPLIYDPRRLEAPLLWLDGRAGPWRAAELTVAEGHVAWLCWRSAQRAGG